MNACFLGANTFAGFRSLFESYLAAVAPGRLFVLKGGAGCGKSSFMERVGRRAEAAGLAVERIYCSGDPDSLDGVYIPGWNAMLVDGTAPHVLEPELVGERGFYLDLSRFYRPGRVALGEATAAYQAQYALAYRCLHAAGALEAARTLPEEAAASIRERALALGRRELRRQGTGGRTLRCWSDAFTGQGLVTLQDSRAALCPRLIGLRGSPAAVSAFLEPLAELAGQRGLARVLCPHPLAEGQLRHLLLPELGLGFTGGQGGRCIHLERMVERACTDRQRRERRELAALQKPLLRRASAALGQARSEHDRLEALVHPLVDFPAVAAQAEALADRLQADCQ